MTTHKYFKALPPLEYLNECFSLDAETGVLTWRERPRHHFTSDRAATCANQRNAGRVAGYTPDKGYIRIQLCWPNPFRVEWYYANRIVYAMCGHSLSPFMCVDHEDGNRANNKPGNLRQVTHAVNNKNMPWHRQAVRRGEHTKQQ